MGQYYSHRIYNVLARALTDRNSWNLGYFILPDVMLARLLMEKVLEFLFNFQKCHFKSENRHQVEQKNRILFPGLDFNICATISWEVFINQRNHFLSCSPDYKTATFQPIINCTVSLNRLWLGKNNSFENQSIICKVHDLDAHYSISCCLLSNPTSRSCFLRKLSDFSF